MPGRHGHATPPEPLKRVQRACLPGVPSRRRGASAFAATALSMLVVCALLTGCGATAAARTTISPRISTPFPTDMPTVPPVTTPAVKAPLSWHISTLPDGATQWFPLSILTVAPSNGDVAYLCDGSQQTNTKFYATHDHGAHWQRMASPPAPADCNPLLVDSSDTNTVLLGSIVTTDGGATWQQRTELPDIIALATWHALRYAIVDVTDTSGTHTMLAVSTDNMRSWHYTDPQAIAPHLTSSEVNNYLLWVDPSTGVALATIRGRMWETQDRGQHWSPLPGQQFPGDSVVVQPPHAGQPWHVCLGFFSYYGEGPFTCTNDGGRTWRDWPAPAVNAGLLAIDADGALLVHTSTALYRLPPGTNQWRALGNIPSFCGSSVGSATYVPSAFGGWWAFPAGGKGACNQFATAPANRS